MQASKLIKEIKIAIEKHGDLDIRLMLFIFTDGTNTLRYGLEEVEVSEADGFIEISADGYA